MKAGVATPLNESWSKQGATGQNRVGADPRRVWSQAELLSHLTPSHKGPVAGGRICVPIPLAVRDSGTPSLFGASQTFPAAQRRVTSISLGR